MKRAAVYVKNPDVGKAVAKVLRSLGVKVKTKRVRKNAMLGEYEKGVFYPLTRRPKSRHKRNVRKARKAGRRRRR